MNSKKLLFNQNGSIVILMTFTLVIASAMVLLQLSSAFMQNNSIQTRDEINFRLRHTTLKFAMAMKKAYDLGQINPACTFAPVGGQNLTPVKINGRDFCMPEGGQLCDYIEVNNEQMPRCVSTSQSNYNVPMENSFEVAELQNSPNRGRSNTDDSQGQSNTHSVRNSITIPAPPDPSDAAAVANSKWKTCSGPADVCVRMVLCPIGERSCALERSSMIQVVKLNP